MIPLQSLSTELLRAPLLYPDNLTGSLLEDWELGGIALQNPTQGLQYQVWRGSWNLTTTEIVLEAFDTGDTVMVKKDVGVFEFAFSFDQNMRYVVAVLKRDSKLYFTWYDSTVENYTTTEFEGITAFKLSHDDKRFTPVQIGISDVIFTYIRNNNLYFRAQRDRYLVEYLLQEDLPPGLLISRFGMGTNNRLQWVLRHRRKGEKLPWLP